MIKSSKEKLDHYFKPIVLKDKVKLPNDKVELSK